MGISPDFAFREDKRRDEAAFKQGKLPSQKVAHYKNKLFETLDGCKFSDPGRKRKSRKNVDPRFFQKSYMRRFLGEEGATSLTRPPSKLSLPPPCMGMDFIPISQRSRDDDAAGSLQGLNSIHFRFLSKIVMKKFTEIFTKKLSKCCA